MIPIKILLSKPMVYLQKPPQS